MRHFGRKCYHVFGGLGLLFLYYSMGRERALLVYAILFFLVLLWDLIRLSVPAWNRYLIGKFGTLYRKNEEHAISGTPTYVLGVALSLYWYAPEIATVAICFLAIGDVTATAIGERYGKTKIGQKSLEGSTAFFLAAVVVGLLLPFFGIYVPVWIVCMGAVVATGVELLSLRVNDNLTIPLIAGGAMQLALVLSY